MRLAHRRAHRLAWLALCLVLPAILATAWSTRRAPDLSAGSVRIAPP